MGRRSATPHLRRKGNAWYYDQGGKPRKWLPLGSDRAKALAKYDELEGRTVINSFGAMLRWFLSTQCDHISVNSMKSYQVQARALERMFGDAPPEAIRPEHIALYRDKIPAASANGRLGLMRQVYSCAIERGMCAVNPVREVRRLKIKARGRYLTDEEFRAIREAVPDYVRCAMDLAYLTGIRPGDVLKIRLSDIGQDGLYVASQKTGTRTLYELTPALADAIAVARSLPRGIKGMHLLCDRRGQPYRRDRVSRAFLVAARSVGIKDAQFRDIRAKSATDEPGTAKARLGHANQAMTDRYIKTRATAKVAPLKRGL